MAKRGFSLDNGEWEGAEGDNEEWIVDEWEEEDNGES
jgi:hypothetical protein